MGQRKACFYLILKRKTCSFRLVFSPTQNIILSSASFEFFDKSLIDKQLLSKLCVFVYYLLSLLLFIFFLGEKDLQSVISFFFYKDRIMVICYHFAFAFFTSCLNVFYLFYFWLLTVYIILNLYTEYIYIYFSRL